MLLAVFVMLLLSAAVMVYSERKVAAFIQQRYGPYLVGPRGMLQPIADVIKLMFKEPLRPVAADKRHLHPRAHHLGHRGLRGVRGRAVRRRDHAFRPARRADRAPGGRRQRGGAGGLRDHLDQRLRHRARRLELEQQVLAPGRAALGVADDQLRAVVRHVARVRARARGLALAHATSSNAQQAGTGSGSSRGGSCSCSPSASSSS